MVTPKSHGCKSPFNGLEPQLSYPLTKYPQLLSNGSFGLVVWTLGPCFKRNWGVQFPNPTPPIEGFPFLGDCPKHGLLQKASPFFARVTEAMSPLCFGRFGELQRNGQVLSAPTRSLGLALRGQSRRAAVSEDKVTERLG